MAKKRLGPRRARAITKELSKPKHVSTHAAGWLTIKDLADLFKHEKAIVNRINATLNGGYLFMTNPLMLFKDIGVNLSPGARAELLKHEPRLNDHSTAAYKALKESTLQQPVKFNLRGLFERERQ